MPSANKNPSLRLPSCRWNDGSLSMKSTPSSSQRTFNPALRVVIRWVTSSPRFRGHTLEMATDADTSLAALIRFSYSCSICATSRLASVRLSQSLPPTTMANRCSFWDVGNFDMVAFMSLIHAPGIHTHLVFNSLFSSISRMRLLPMTVEPVGRGSALQCAALVSLDNVPILVFNSLFLVADKCSGYPYL